MLEVLAQVVNSTIIRIALEIAIGAIIVFIGLTCALMISSDILEAHNRRKYAKKVNIRKVMTKEEFDKFMERFNEDDSD